MQIFSNPADGPSTTTDLLALILEEELGETGERSGSQPLDPAEFASSPMRLNPEDFSDGIPTAPICRPGTLRYGQNATMMEDNERTTPCLWTYIVVPGDEPAAA